MAAAPAPTNFGDFTTGEGSVVATPGEGSAAPVAEAIENTVPEAEDAAPVAEATEISAPEAEEPGAKVEEPSAVVNLTVTAPCEK